MPWVPNPLYVMVGEWILRNGVPIVARRLIRSTPKDILFEGEATIERGPETARGLLALTPDALVFIPSSVRTRGTATSLPLEDIEDVAPVRGRLLGLIPAPNNGLRVRTRRGSFRFRVDPADRDAWLRAIEGARTRDRGGVITVDADS